ncbi:alpha/beta hydrolase family protein [Schlesneria paludicola]|uniref:alpha/beta hydrolase family protein n=1 Tax=Schlesneria paludicola TaxID=360056 RepID=UPI00029AAF01|nr:alpha/beta hydrolase [Schlesneria paludicola]
MFDKLGYLTVSLGLFISFYCPAIAWASEGPTSKTPVATNDDGAEKPLTAEDVKGNWLGTINAGVVKLRLGFAVVGTKPEQLKVRMFSVDQGNAEIPVDVIKLDANKVSMQLTKISATFQGTWNSQTNEIAGNWKQGAQSFPITLKKVESLPNAGRPQDPSKPYPYLEEDVTFTNAKHNVTLKGTLTQPKGSGPFPAVVLISGSGPQDRNEEIAGHRPFLVLADALTRRGIAVLRFDDRDFEKPDELFKATSEDLSHDVLAAVSFLRARPQIAATKIGLVGHSEGGLIAPMLASRDKEIALIVMIAGPGVSGDVILNRQQDMMRERAGVSEATRAKDRATSQEWFDIIKAEPDNAQATKKIEAAFEKSHPESDAAEKDALKIGVKTLLTPWFRFFISYDPQPALTNVKCPVLAVIGEKDLQVPAAQNLKVIEAALKAGGNKNFLAKELPGLNHLLQPCVTGFLDEYSTIETTIDPDALKLISDWIVARMSK